MSSIQAESSNATTALGMFVLMALAISAASWPSWAYESAAEAPVVLVRLATCVVSVYWMKSPSMSHTNGFVGHALYVCWA